MRADPVANAGIVAYEVTQTTCGAVVRTLEALAGTEFNTGASVTYNL